MTVVTESKEELVLDSPVVIISSSGSLSSPRQQMAEKERRRKIRIGTMMCISYSALIGGTGSLTGSSTQLAFKGILQQSVECLLFLTKYNFNCLILFLLCVFKDYLARQLDLITPLGWRLIFLECWSTCYSPGFGSNCSSLVSKG